MANPLDEVTGPVNEQGREVLVIEKQLPVEIGVGSAIFEIAVFLSGFAVAAVVQFTVEPRWESRGCLIPVGGGLIGGERCAWIREIDPKG